MTERRLAKSQAPCIERKPPEIFWRSLPIRRSRSASLLENGVRRSVRKRQAPFLVLLEPEREVVTDASLFSSALSGLERRHLFVRGDGPLEDAVPGCECGPPVEAGTSRSFSRAKRAALWARVRSRCVLVAQSSFSISIRPGAHAGDGRAGPVAHAFESEVGGVIVVDDDAGELLVEMAAPGGDAQTVSSGVHSTWSQWVRAAMRMPVSSRCLTGAAVRMISETRSRKPLKRRAVRLPMAAMVAVESFTAKSSLMTSATRFSGMNWACDSRSPTR